MASPPSPPLISIIIPTYNSEKTIRCCLDSIANQTQKNIEVIIIDGQSSDKTLEIVKDYAVTEKYIRFISEADTGIYNAMNKGIKLSKGDWLYFLGSDDSLYNGNTIGTITPFLTEDTDIFYGDVLVQKNNITQSRKLDKINIYKQNVCHQAIFYKRHVFYKIGYYDESYKILSDWKHNMMCIGNTKRIKHANITVATYSGTGISANNTDTLFYGNKIEIYRKAMNVSHFNSLMTPLRYDFHRQSRNFMNSGKSLKSILYYLLYAYHGVLSRINNHRLHRVKS